MDRKRLAASLPWIVGIGFCVVEVINIALLSDSTADKNPANGHVEPMLFAPQVSTDWRYVTDGQMMFVTIALVAVLLLAGLQLTARWWARDEEPSDPTDTTDSAPAEPHASLSVRNKQATPEQAVRAPFGHRAR